MSAMLKGSLALKWRRSLASKSIFLGVFGAGVHVPTTLPLSVTVRGSCRTFENCLVKLRVVNARMSDILRLTCVLVKNQSPSSNSDTGQFLIRRHVDNLELFGVQGGVFAELQLPEVTLLDLNHVLLVFSAEAFENGRVHDDQELEV